MLPVAGILLLLVLVAVLVLLYKSERAANKGSMSRAVAEEYWHGKERRRHVRFNKSIEVCYTLHKKKHFERVCRTIDISEGGVKLVIDEKFENGTVMDLQIVLPDTKKAAVVVGEVVWAEDGKQFGLSDKRLFYLGVKFLTVKEPYGNYLINYIRSMATESEVK